MIIYRLDVLLSQFWTSPLFHVLTVASWPAYRFLRRQVRWSSISISKNFPQFVVIYTVKGCEWSRSLSGILLLFLWSNRCWQFVGFAWREEKWEMSYSDSGRSRVGVACAEWWTHDNPARLRQTGKRRQEALCHTLWPPKWSHQHALNLKKVTLSSIAGFVMTAVCLVAKAPGQTYMVRRQLTHGSSACLLDTRQLCAEFMDTSDVGLSCKV